VSLTLDKSSVHHGPSCCLQPAARRRVGSPPVGIPSLKPGRSAPHVKRRLFLHPGTVLRTKSRLLGDRGRWTRCTPRLLLRYRNDALSLDVRKGPRL